MIITYLDTVNFKQIYISNYPYQCITNTAWVRARLCKLQKGRTRLVAANDKAYQLLAHGRLFSPASSTTKAVPHDIAQILLKVALSTKIQSINPYHCQTIDYRVNDTPSTCRCIDPVR
jgi:hypothetical protein